MAVRKLFLLPGETVSVETHGHILSVRIEQSHDSDLFYVNDKRMQIIGQDVEAGDTIRFASLNPQPTIATISLQVKG